MFLDEKTIIQVTGARRKSTQVKRLREMRINHDIRPDGFPLVLQSHIEKRFDGKPTRQKPEMGPIA